MKDEITQTVPLKDGGDIPVAELVGRVIQFYVEGGGKFGGIRLVTAESLEAVVRKIRERKFTVWIYPK